MSRLTDGAEALKCSFCGKSQKQVRKLIGGSGVYICNECVDLCNEIIAEDTEPQSAPSGLPLPKPREIFEFLDSWVPREPVKPTWRAAWLDFWMFPSPSWTQRL